MQLQPRFPRFAALFTAAVLSSATLLHPAAAHADKSKNLKYGAIALGVAGAYLLAKGKTVPAVAAAAGGYYAYKKSGDVKDDRYEDRYGDRYGDRYDNRNARYPDGGYSYSNAPRPRANASQPQQNRRGNYDLRPYLR